MREAPPGIWRGDYLPVTAGAVALVFLAALQALAITTVMPLVSADLDGDALYAVAFAGTLATSVVGMVGAGVWSDRGGPTPPLVTSVALFVAGLILAGVAPTMELLVVGRLVQGVGIGGVNVALYVVVARVFPPVLHGRVFAAFSAAWVVPSLVGPALAGAVAEYLHWRWVFLGVAVLSVAALLLVAPRLRGLAPRSDDSGADAGSRRTEGAAGAPAITTRMLPRLVAAVTVAVALLVLSIAGSTGPLTLPLVVVALVAAAAGIRALLPRGTLRAAPGLPSVILMRGVLAGAFFSAEVYIPLFFVDVHGFTGTWAGVALTLAAVAWSVASDLQGRGGARWADTRVAVASAVMLVLSLAAVTASAGLTLHPAFLIVSWGLAGAGLGLVYPRLSVLTLAYSTPADQGANSAALTISDAVGAAATIAVLGLVFTAVRNVVPDDALAFPVLFALATVVGVVALLPARRVH